MQWDLKVAILMTGRPQYEIAQELGISESHLSRFLHGRADLTPDQIATLKVIVGLSPECPNGPIS